MTVKLEKDRKSCLEKTQVSEFYCEIWDSLIICLRAENRVSLLPSVVRVIKVNVHSPAIKAPICLLQPQDPGTSQSLSHS